MQKSNRARVQKKKVTLPEVQEDENDEGLLTYEEQEMMRANQKPIQNDKSRIKSDSLIEKSIFNRNIQQQPHRQNIFRNQNLNESIQSNTTNRSKNRMDFSVDIDDEDEEDPLKQLKDEDVNSLLENVIKKRDFSLGQKKNQDYFCQILAQMILKNKINKENAFDVPLPDVQNMTDFQISNASWQKLSISLDSGAKVYGYRVDSLHQESFKMLGGLIRQEYQFGNPQQEALQQSDDNEDLINKEREKIFKKNKKINESTLEKNGANITLHKYDIQFEVDPLFCRTSAKFDDGSSKGILLNNIKIDSNLKLLIDSENFVHNLTKDSSARKSLPQTMTPEKQSQQTNKRKQDKTQLDSNNFNKWFEFNMRQDLQNLELCSGLDNFIENMMSFDDSTRKQKKGLTQEEDDSVEEIRAMDNFSFNENDEQLMNDINIIISQTAKKGFNYNNKQKEIQSGNKYMDSQFEDNNDNDYKSNIMTPLQYLSQNSQSQQIQYNSNDRMEVINEGPQFDDFNGYQDDKNNNNDNSNSNQFYNDEIPQSEQGYKLYGDDLTSKESSNGFTEAESVERMFSLQNIVLRMTQIGNGQFFNNIQNDKNQWMNPTDWKMQNIKKNSAMVPEVKKNESSQRNRKTAKNESDFKIDFFDDQELKESDVMKSRQTQVPQRIMKVDQLGLLSIDFHYKPQWLFKTSYFDLKHIEEQERLEKQRLQKQEEEYRGFNGDDEFEYINQIDEQTLLGATPFKAGQMEVMDSQDNNYEMDEPIPYFRNQDEQIGQTQQYNSDQYTQSNYIDSKNQKNQTQKKQIQRKMKIQELKSRLWSRLSEQLEQKEESSEQASIQSCLVAVLHLCNENNLSLINNNSNLDNFMIQKSVNQTQQIEEIE